MSDPPDRAALARALLDSIIASADVEIRGGRIFLTACIEPRVLEELEAWEAELEDLEPEH